MPKVLIVDDEADLELLIRQKFRKRIAAGDLDLSFARNGEEALRSLSANGDIEIVVTGINMPVMDGLTLLSRIRQLPRLTKVVIVSAYDDLNNIRTAMNRGAYDFLTKPIDFGDLELTLAKTDEELRLIKQGLEAQQQLRALEYELQVATKIQQSILPETLTGHDKFEISATMLPARQVSGDFFDFFLIDANTLAVAMGDVSGKGIPAALFMAVTRTLLRATGLQTRSPGECLEQVNRLLLKQGKGEVYVTLFYAVLDLESGCLEFARGAHTPAYLASQHCPMRRLEEPGGMMLGMFEEASYPNGRHCLEPGDSLILYTDGITEAENAQRDFFTERRLEGLVEQIKLHSAEQIVLKVIESVRTFSGDLPQSDDMTVMALRWKP